MKTNFLVVILLFNLLLLNKLNAQSAKFVEYTWHPANATTLSNGLPDQLLTDELFKVEITMQNNGTTTWGNAVDKTKVTMVSKNNNFNMNWGTYFISIGQGNNVAPGASFTFWSWLKAPHEPGDYVFSWQCQEWLPSDPNLPPDTASAFFGDITTPQTITVVQRTETAPQQVRKEPVIDSSDFEYAGSFVVPSIPNYDNDYTYSDLTIKKEGNEKHLLLLAGTYTFSLFEINIPQLTKITETDNAAIQKATVVRNWGSLGYGTVNGENILPNAGFWYDNQNGILYWNHNHSYYTGPSNRFPILVSTKLNNDGTKTNLKGYYFKSGLSTFKSFWGGITELSDDFAQKYTQGRTLALGFGGYYSICATASRGPALAAISEPNQDTVLDLLPMLYYPDPKACKRNGNYINNIGYWSTPQPSAPWDGLWTGKDLCGSGVFIDLPDQKGYINFAYQGIGRLGYDFGGYNFDGHYQHAWYFYDIDELGKAASGSIDPTSIQPTSYSEIKYPVKSQDVSGACFDNETRMLYLYCRNSFKGDPIVHTYYLKQRVKIEIGDITSLCSSFRNTTLSNLSSPIACYSLANATSYEWFFVTGKDTLRATTTSADTTFIPGKAGLKFGTAYSVSISALVGNTWSAPGEAFTITTPATRATTLAATYRYARMKDWNRLFRAHYMGGAMRYEFVFTNKTTGEVLTYLSKNHAMCFKSLAGAQAGHTYLLKIRPWYYQSVGSFGTSFSITAPK